MANGFNKYKAQLETFNHRKLQLNNKREVLNTKIKEYLNEVASLKRICLALNLKKNFLIEQGHSANIDITEFYNHDSKIFI